jgi:serine/threonine protein kinase
MPFDGLHIGHYILLRSIGSGAMGEVYLAEDPRIHRQVAIKVVRSEISAYYRDSVGDAQRLFLREAKAIAQLDHPHILPLFDYGEENINGTTLTYLVMPFRPEGSLTRWLEQRNSGLLPLEDSIQLVRQAASALQYAHDQQIIHQDVKPANFLMRANSERPHLPDIVLADFGVARSGNTTSSMSHSIRGTPTYMAPEQWSGETVPATDQYALAVMAYELLTGQPPFQGPPMQMMYHHTNTLPQPASKLNPSLPAEVDSVLLTALAKKPEERFLAIAVFAHALQQATQYTTAATVIRTPHSASTGNVRATLAISKKEAQDGTTRTLNLPGGRQMTITVPAGSYDGQVLRIEDHTAGVLIITLQVKETEPTFLPVKPGQEFDRTIRSSNPALPPPSMSPAGRGTPTPVPSAPGLRPDIADNQQNTARRQGIAGGTAILLVGLALLIIAGSAGFFYLQNNNRSSSSNPDAIATIHASDATSFAATSTTLASKNTGTPTSQPATPTTTAGSQTTPTTANTVPYPPPGAVLALNDPLTDNSLGYNWTENNTGTGSCSFTGSGYDVTSPQTPLYHGCVAQNTSFSNFAYEIHLTFISGNCGAIIFRADVPNHRYYYFRICANGTYQLLLYTQSGYATRTFADSNSSAIHMGPGQSNVIAVVANGSHIAAYINDQPVVSIIDSTCSQGQIGVAADNDNSPTEIVFSNAKVWTF